MRVTHSANIDQSFNQLPGSAAGTMFQTRRAPAPPTTQPYGT